MQNPKLHIVTPIYRSYKLCIRMVQSLNQIPARHLPNLILIDDTEHEFKDHSFENIVKGIYKGKVSFINNDKNYGVSYSRNKGFETVPIGETIVFFDSDDMWIPNNYFTFLSHLSRFQSIDLLLFSTDNLRIGTVSHKHIVMPVTKLLRIDYGLGERLLVINKKDHAHPFIDYLNGFEITSLFKWGVVRSRTAVYCPVSVRAYTSDNVHSLSKRAKTYNRCKESVVGFYYLGISAISAKDTLMSIFAAKRVLKWLITMLIIRYHR
jgi:glycosyltransferase involved in cell wall biosynthesis